MKMKSYEDLLEKAIDELPEEMIKRERFNFPKVSTQREGSRTIIKNFSSVAKDVNRDEKHLYKQLVKSLGTAGFLESGRVILQGKFTEEDIQREVDNYVKEFVICKECGAPDTDFVKEDRVLFVKCLACGAKHSVRT